MLGLDLLTLRIVATVITFISVLALFSFWRLKALRPGAGYWVLGGLSYACVYLVSFFLETSLVSNILSAAFIMLSSLLLLHGTRKTLRKSSFLKFEIVAFISAFLVVCYFTLIDKNVLYRVVSYSIYTFAVSLAVALTLITERKSEWRTSLLTSSAVFLLYAFYNLAHAAYLIFSKDPDITLSAGLYLSSSVFVFAITWSLVLIAYDILETESRQSIYESYQRVKEVESSWLLALDCSNAGAWDWEVSKPDLQFSDHWKALLGYAADEEMDNSVEALQARTHPDDLKVIVGSMDALLKGEATHAKNEHRIRRKDDSWMWVSSSSTILHAGGTSGVTRIIGINIDVSEHKAAELALQKAKDEAEFANKAKTTFLSNMSHEIRTPMNAILGFSQLLRDDPSTNNSQQESLNIINKSGEHLLSLIDDILDWSRIESGNSRVQMLEINVKELFEEIGAAFSGKIMHKPVQLSIELSEFLPEVIRSDPMRIRQICTNLLGNAFKFTHQGKVVLKVELGETADLQTTLIVQVIDTGVGIAESEQEIIFSVFGQTESGLQSAQGSGLGLFISKNMAGLLGGDLQFTSKVDVGSCFVLELPVEIVSGVGGACEVDASNYQVAESLVQPGVRLLIIDDIASNRLLIKKILDGLGFEVLETDNAVDGMQLIDSFKPDLILMDVRMPGLAGDKAIVEIRNRPFNSNVPIIAVTANVLEGEKERLLAIGANDFIGKPFEKSVLLEKIGLLLSINYRYAKQRDS